MILVGFLCYLCWIGLSEEFPLIGTLIFDNLEEAKFIVANDYVNIDQIKDNYFQIIRKDEELLCEASTSYGNSTKNFIVLTRQVQQGRCELSLMAYNSRKTGAFALIVQADRQAQLSNAMSMLTIGLIDHKNASVISNQQPNENGTLVGRLSVKRSVQRHQQIHLWLSSMDPFSYRLVDTWKNVLLRLPVITTKVDWRPRIVSRSLPSDQNQKVYEYSCACSSRFCSPFDEVSNHPLISQDIRQHIIHQQNPLKYLQYMQIFGNNCIQNYLLTKSAEGCSETLMCRLSLRTTLVHDIVQDFLKNCAKNKNSELYSMLQEDRLQFSFQPAFPLITLNTEVIQYSDEDHLIATLCQKLKLDGNEACEEMRQLAMGSIVTGIVVVSILFGLGLVLLVMHKRKLQRQMNKEVKMQVSTAIDNYIVLNQVSKTQCK